MHTKLIERLTSEFGTPQTSLRWSLAPTGAGRATVNVYMDGQHDGLPGTVKVWVFNPATSTVLNTIAAEIGSQEDLERLIERIKTEVASETGL